MSTSLAAASQTIHGRPISIPISVSSLRSGLKKIHWRGYYELARLHNPVGTFLFYWPFAWGLLMQAHRGAIDPFTLVSRLALYALSSLFLRSAACVLNDMCDVEYDRQVERTKTRPLPMGWISMTGAGVYTITLSAGYLYTLNFVSNRTAMLHGVFNLLILNTAYPLMKRVTYWPQAWLGLAINWGFVIAWLDVTKEDVNWPLMITMMLGMACWTIVYDTIYGCMDMKDDVKIGVKSTSLLFAGNLTPILYTFATGFIAFFILGGYLNGHGLFYYLISVGGAASHILWQIYTLDPNVPHNCKERFKSNVNLGYIVAAGLALDYVTRFL